MDSSLLSRRKNLASLVCLLGGAGFAVAQADKDGGQPEMHAALEHLNQAKVNLEKGAHDKGGHRVRALELVNQAIAEVKEGMQFAVQH
jgi:hypothetical protein